MNKKTVLFLTIILAIFFIGAINITKKNVPQLVNNTPVVTNHIVSGSFDSSKFKTDVEWKKILTPEQFHIVREAGTEIPFTGALDHEERAGTYYSVGCNEAVFRSEQKFDSGTGWPSFWDPINPDSLVLREDVSLGEKRIEVLDKCGGHLGHVFDDGPTTLPDGRQATGKRYCMNSAALKFIPDKK